MWRKLRDKVQAPSHIRVHLQHPFSNEITLLQLSPRHRTMGSNLPCKQRESSVLRWLLTKLICYRRRRCGEVRAAPMTWKHARADQHDSPLKAEEIEVLRAQYEKEGEYVGVQTKFNYAWVSGLQNKHWFPDTC